MQSFGQSNDQSMDQSFNLPINQSSMSTPIKTSQQPTLSQSINQLPSPPGESPPMNRPNQSISQSSNQSTSHNSGNSPSGESSRDAPPPLQQHGMYPPMMVPYYHPYPMNQMNPSMPPPFVYPPFNQSQMSQSPTQSNQSMNPPPNYPPYPGFPHSMPFNAMPPSAFTPNKGGPMGDVKPTHLTAPFAPTHNSPLPITIIRLTRKHIKSDHGGLDAPLSAGHMVQSHVKSKEVNYMQRIQGTMMLPQGVSRGEGKLYIGITAHASSDPTVIIPMRPSKQSMYDVRPFFDYTFNEVNGFTFVGNDYWNGTVKSGDYQSISCLLSSECERIEFTGSIVRPDASYNKRSNCWNSVTVQIDWLPHGHSSSVCCWAETMRGHRRVAADQGVEATEVIPSRQSRGSAGRARKRTRQSDGGEDD